MNQWQFILWLWATFSHILHIACAWNAYICLSDGFIFVLVRHSLCLCHMINQNMIVWKHQRLFPSTFVAFWKSISNGGSSYLKLVLENFRMMKIRSRFHCYNHINYCQTIFFFLCSMWMRTLGHPFAVDNANKLNISWWSHAPIVAQLFSPCMHSNIP